MAKVEVWICGVKQKVLKKRKRGRPKNNTVVVSGRRIIIPKNKVAEWEVWHAINGLK